MLLKAIGDFERISDHSVNVLESIEELREKKIELSESAKHELSVLRTAVDEILVLTKQAFIENNLAVAYDVEPLEQVVDGLMFAIRSGHINRLQSGECTIELGFVLSDIINNYERISDHCSNIGVTLIEVAQNSYDTHEYLNSVKSNENREFKDKFDAYAAKYSLK